MRTPLTSLLLLLPDDPPLEGSAPGSSSVVTQLGSLVPILALEPGSVPAGNAGDFARVPEASTQMQVAQEGQLSALGWGPRRGVGLVLGDGGLAHKARVKEDEAPGCQVEHQEGKETHRFPAEVPLEFEPELGHSGIIPAWLGVGVGLREGRDRAAFPEVRLGMAPLGVFSLIPSAQATAKTRAGGQVQHLALAERREDRAHRPFRDQGELLWATKGVWRLRTSGSWSHFPTLFFASESPQRTLKTATAGRFCESPAAAVHFSPLLAS